MAREYIDELADGTINPETSGVDSQATDNGTHVKTLAPIYYTPATIANDGKATRETPVTIKSALDGKQNTLATQTAYSAKGTATKVPQITTNSLGQVTGITEVTISGVTPASHTHGNIANGGTLTDTAAAAAGNDYVVIRDADNAKIQTSTIKGTDVADAVSKKHSHSTLTLSTTAQSYDGSHTLALPSTDPYTSARTPSSHASTATTYGIGTTSTYGHVKLATGDMNGATNTDGVAVSKNHTHSQYAPKASPALTGTPTAPTAADGTNTTQIATTAFVQSAVAQGLAVSDAMVYKGTITLGATSPGGLTVAADKGHTYKVVANGTTKEGYVDGVKVEAGDMVICNTDSTAAATSSNYSTIAAKWDFVQGNTDGVVVGPSSAVSGNVVLFDGATGKLVKDGGILGTAAFKSVTDTYSSTGTDPVSGKAVAAAINALDVTEVGGDGKYIKKIKEDDGKITATVETMDTTPTASSIKAVTSGGIKSALEGKSSTSHTHSVSINGSTKTIAASGGTAVDLGTYKVFNYAKVFTSKVYNANTNRYILLAFNTATYTGNWEESSMFKLVVHDGQLPKELVFRLWLKGSISIDVVPDDPSNPKLYRVYSENFSESALNILDVRLFVVEKSAGSIQFTIGIFIDRNYLQGQYISYQLYPLSYETRDRGNTIDSGLSNWTYTVGQDIYRSNNQHSVFTTAFEVNDLSVDMSATKAVKLNTARKLAVSLSNTSTDTSFDGSADVTNIKTTGILPVSNGGTGKNFVTAGNYLVGNGTNALVEKAPNVAANDLINALSVGNSTPGGDDYYVSQYANGGTTTTSFHRRPVKALWEYIKSQISSVLGLTATNYGGNAATATTVTSANITRTPDTTNGDKLQIGSGTAANVVNSKSTLNVAASAATTNTNARHIWFSESSTETKRAYSDDLTYRTDYNRITTNISGYATGLTKQRDIQHQGATTNHPVHRIASYPSPNITAQGAHADNSLVLHLFTKGHNASDYGIVLITVKLASPVSNNPTVNVRWKLRSSGMPTDAVQAAFIKDASGMWHVDVFFIVQHQYQLTVFNKLGSFSALDGSPYGGWVLHSSNVDISYADGKECYTDISGDSADTASKRLYNSIGYDGAATGITDDGIVGTASKLSSYGGGTKQPVYFPSTGVNAGKPVAMDTVSHDNETYLDMNVERAYSAVAANSANTAGGLSLSSAVGSGTRPVYFNAQGAPLPIDYTNEEYLGNPVLNLTVTKARNALYVNGYSLAVGSYGGVSNRIYFC